MSAVEEITGKSARVETKGRPFDTILDDVVSRFQEGVDLVTVAKAGPNLELDSQDFEELGQSQLKAVVYDGLNI